MGPRILEDVGGWVVTERHADAYGTEVGLVPERIGEGAQVRYMGRE